MTPKLQTLSRTIVIACCTILAPAQPPPSETGIELTDLGIMPGGAHELGGVGLAGPYYATTACARSLNLDTWQLMPSEHPHAGSIMLMAKSDHDHLEVQKTIAINGQIAGLAWGENQLWAAVYDHRRIYRSDIATGRVSPGPPTPNDGVWGGLAHDGEHLWLHGTDDPDRSHTGKAPHRICRVSADSGEILHELPSDPMTQGLAWLDGWLATSINTQEEEGDRPSSIRLLDPRNGEVVADYPLPANLYPHGITRLSSTSILIAMQVGEDMRAPMHLYRADLKIPNLSGRKPAANPNKEE